MDCLTIGDEIALRRPRRTGEEVMTPDVPIPDVETIRKEKKPFAHFQWNYGWGHWEQVIEEAAGHDGVFAAYLAPCDHDNKLERLNAENARLREALKKIATIQGGGDCCSVYEWFVYAKRIARAALAEQEKM